MFCSVLKKNIQFSSDFIISYPGEEEEDFKATFDLIKNIKFINSFSFIFSPRPGTAASNLKLIDKKVEFHAGGLSLGGLWASLSEYASATYESWADIKEDIDAGNSQQIPLILFKAIPKFPHSINKRKIE